jgi:hypothetical protein
MTHSLLQQALDVMLWDNVLGTVIALQLPSAWRTSAVEDGATLAPSPPAAMHAPEVVQATLCKGTSILMDGVPLRCGGATTLATDPQPARARAATTTTNAERHGARACSDVRLMTFPVFSRHAPLGR